MPLMYLVAGVLHFVFPATYVSIMPRWLPWHYGLVYMSGLCEIVCAVLLIIPATRHTGAWLTIALLIAVFPANIQMAVNYYKGQNPYLWVAIVRLPLQFLLICWVWLYTKK